MATVFAARLSRSPIAALPRPPASRSRISRSRGGELGERRLGRARPGPEEGQHPLGHPGPEDGLAPGDGGDPAEDLLLRRTLDQVAAGTGPHRGEHRVVVLVHGQDQHRDRRRHPGDLAGRLEPVHARHLQVDQRDVGGVHDRLAHGLGAVAGLRDHLEAGHRGEQGGQAVAHDRVVVGDQHPDGAHDATSGNVATTRPPDPSGPASSRPPSSSMRWRMPDRPDAGLPVGGAVAVVEDLHLELVAAAEGQARARRRRMPRDVGERLGGDPVDGDLEGGRQRRQGVGVELRRPAGCRRCGRTAAPPAAGAPRRDRARRAPAAGAGRPPGARSRSPAALPPGSARPARRPARDRWRAGWRRRRRTAPGRSARARGRRAARAAAGAAPPRPP